MTGRGADDHYHVSTGLLHRPRKSSPDRDKTAEPSEPYHFGPMKGERGEHNVCANRGDGIIAGNYTGRGSRGSTFRCIRLVPIHRRKYQHCNYLMLKTMDRGFYNPRPDVWWDIRLVMLAKIISAALVGLDACLIEVEVDIAGGLPQFSVVGLPDATVRESRDRVRSALKNTGFHFPAKRITVNLAPAGIKKEGSSLDLAIAIGILVAEELIPSECVAQRVFVGELYLDGQIKRIPGALSISMACRPHHSLILPADNSQEAAMVEDVAVYPLHTLPEAVAFIKGVTVIEPTRNNSDDLFRTRPSQEDDYGDVKGQEHAK